MRLRFYAVAAGLPPICSFIGHAIPGTQTTLDGALFRARLWQSWAGLPLSQWHVKMPKRLLAGFDGKSNRSKWV